MPPGWGDITKEGLRQASEAITNKKDAFNLKVKDANKNADLTFASLVNATADGFNTALDKTIPAFMAGRTMEGTAGMLEMIGSLTPMMGALGGPAGAALGGIVSLALGIVSSILSAFEPQRKSLVTEIKEEIRHLHAQLIHDELTAALNDLDRAAGPIQAVTPNSRTWEQMQSGWINMFEGNAAHQLNLTKSWLEKAENQDNPEWELIFEVYWHVTALRFQLFAVILTKLTAEQDAQAIGGIALRERRERDHEFAVQLYPVVLNKGTLWHAGGGPIYVRNGLVTGKDYSKIVDDKDRMMVGPVTKRLYVMNRHSGKVSFRDPATQEWKVCFEPSGGAIDFWLMAEESGDPKIKPGERIVVVNKDGNTIESKLAIGQVPYAVGKTNLEVKNVRQFRSAQDAAGKTYYFCLGEKGKIYIGLPPAPGEGNPLGAQLNLRLLIDFNDDLLGLAVGKTDSGTHQVIAYSQKSIRVRKLQSKIVWSRTNPDGYPTDDHSNWLPMNLPPEVNNRNITCIAASKTGQVLAAFDRKLWVYMPTSQQQDGNWNWSWEAERKGDMDWLCEEPIKGFDTYREFCKA